MSTVFYDTLSQLEQAYWHRLAEVFALVNPQKPEKGLITLIQRTRNEAQQTGENLEVILEKDSQGGKERTERRVALLNQCPSTLQSAIHPSVWIRRYWIRYVSWVSLVITSTRPA